MVHMGVRKYHGVQFGWVDGPRVTITLRKLFGSLVHSAIDKDFVFSYCDKVLGTGYGLGGAKKSNGWDHSLSLADRDDRRGH
jgi:hypothetical protein